MSDQLTSTPKVLSIRNVDGQALFFGLLTIVALASAFVAIRGAVLPGGYSPQHLTLLRFLSASGTLLVCTFFFEVRRPAFADLPFLSLVALIGIAVYHGVLNFASTKVDSGTASFLVSLSPVFTALAATLFLKERLRWCGCVALVFRFWGP